MATSWTMAVGLKFLNVYVGVLSSRLRDNTWGALIAGYRSRLLKSRRPTNGEGSSGQAFDWKIWPQCWILKWNLVWELTTNAVDGSHMTEECVCLPKLCSWHQSDYDVITSTSLCSSSHKLHKEWRMSKIHSPEVTMQ